MSRQKDRWVPEAVRRAVYARDDRRCVYCCGQWECRRTVGFDHVVPFLYGGKHTPENLVAACTACNGSKGVRVIVPPIWFPPEVIGAALEWLKAYSGPLYLALRPRFPVSLDGAHAYPVGRFVRVGS